MTHVRHRADRNDLAVCQRGNAVADRAQAFQIMRHHEHGETKRLLQGADQFVEVAGRDRIKSRGGLIQEDQLRIERERTGQCHALGHSTREFGRQFISVTCVESDHLELGEGSIAQQALR